MLSPVYIRADSSPAIGAGHAMRTLAIAEEQKRRGRRVVLIANETLPLVEKAWHALGCEMVRPRDLSAQHMQGADVIIDGYGFDDAAERTLAGQGARIVAFDDHKHARHDAASLVLNSAPNARALGYVAPPVHLLGVSFAQVRSAFVECARARAARAARKLVGGAPSRRMRCVIVPGASDTRGIGPAAVRAAASAGFDVVVAVGSGGPSLDARMRALRESGESVEVEIIVDADLPSLFAEIDVAIAAAGSTALDACAAGVPTVAVCTAENQRALYTGLVTAGAVLAGGDVGGSNSEGVIGVDRLRDESVRNDLTRRARLLVDGRGAARLANAMAHPELIVRRTHSDDARLLFAWSNQASVRAASFNSAPIEWDTHVGWLEKKLGTPERALMLVGESASGPVGQVRFDIAAGENSDATRATISVSVDEAVRARPNAKGTGAALIRARVEELFVSFERVSGVDAEIKPDNVASLRAFANAGFREHTTGERVVMRMERTS